MRLILLKSTPLTFADIADFSVMLSKRIFSENFSINCCLEMAEFTKRFIKITVESDSVFTPLFQARTRRSQRKFLFTN